MRVNIIKRILPILFLFILCFFGPAHALAKSYLIDKVDINANLNSDESMNVEENRKYNFDGNYTFAFQYIMKQGGGGAG